MGVGVLAEERRQRAVARKARLSPESPRSRDIAVIGKARTLTTKDTKEHKGRGHPGLEQYRGPPISRDATVDRKKQIQHDGCEEGDWQNF